MHAPEPHLVASDVEGTLTTAASWEALRDHLRQEGRERAFRRYFLRRLPSLLAYRWGIGDRQAFKDSWVRGILALFAGQTVEEFGSAAGHAAGHLWSARRPAVLQALLAHHDAGATIVLASGVFQPILDAFAGLAAASGLERVRALGTPLEIVAGRLTGRAALPLSVGALKAHRLQELAGPARFAAAYGDTAADLPMLRLSQRPVAVTPDDVLRAAATAAGWPIIEG
jgi:phosphoserine phosphatase